MLVFSQQLQLSVLHAILYATASFHRQERPYHDDSTASRLLSEVKHHRARLVLRWGTTLESRVLFFCHPLSFCLFPCSSPCFCSFHSFYFFSFVSYCCSLPSFLHVSSHTFCYFILTCTHVSHLPFIFSSSPHSPSHNGLRKCCGLVVPHTTIVVLVQWPMEKDCCHPF